eukprot:1698163-Amphidinium_carterae.2
MSRLRFRGPGAHTVWTDGSGRHSSNHHLWRCGVGYYTDIGESAELLATVRALEECKPMELVSDCKGVVACLHALRAGKRQPKKRRFVWIVTDMLASTLV